MIINELKRDEIIKRTKAVTGRGSNKTTSKLSRYNSRLSVPVKSIKVTDIKFSDISEGQDNLVVYLTVSSKYEVSIQMQDFMKLLRMTYKNNYERLKSQGGTKSKLMRKLLDMVFNRCFMDTDLMVNCTCPDFQYRYAYVATLLGYKFGEPETRPASNRNPNNEGGVCKHVIAVLNRPSQWKQRVITEFLNYIRENPDVLQVN